MSNTTITRDHETPAQPRTPDLFPVTVFGINLQIPVDQQICFTDGYRFYGEEEAQEREMKFALYLEKPEVGPPKPHMELFIPYEYGGFDSSCMPFDVEKLENFLRPAHFDKKYDSVTIPGLYQDNHPVTVTITEEDFGATPTIEIVRA